MALVATFWRRVANERMNTRSLRRLFIRMRSPSSAPPVRRRVGSTATSAIERSGNHCSSRETSSSVTVLLPAPPVPVMPTSGTPAPATSQAACVASSASPASTPSSIADSMRAIARSSPAPGAGTSVATRARAARSTRSSIMPCSPSWSPSFGW